MLIGNAKLVRRVFADRPDWQVIKDDVPLGKKYIIVGNAREALLINTETNEKRLVKTYMAIDEHGVKGYLVAEMLEITNVTNTMGDNYNAQK